MVNCQNLNPRGQNSIDNAVVATKQLPNIITPQFRNHLSGRGKASKPLYGSTQVPDEGRRGRRSIPGYERSNFAQILSGCRVQTILVGIFPLKFSHEFFVLHHVAGISLGDPELDFSDKVQPINHFVQRGVIRERIDYGDGCLFRCHYLTVEYC